MGMILLFYGGLEVEVVGCACLGVLGWVCVGLRVKELDGGGAWSRGYLLD